MPDERRFEGEDLVDWAIRTDRLIAGPSAEGWRRRLAEERHRVIASAGPGGTVEQGEVERTLLRLASVPGVNDPGYRAGMVLASGAAAPALSRTEQLERMLYGPTREERYAEEDARAERELVELEQAEQERVAASALTDAEFEALFGPGKKG
jgi:hypothetical protein